MKRRPVTPLVPQKGGVPVGASLITVATLPANPLLGQMAVITDGTAGTAWAATPVSDPFTGKPQLVWWNGTGWKLFAK